MNGSFINQDKFWTFADICHFYGLRDSFDHLLRVLQTREALNGQDASSIEEVYRVMQSSSQELPRFQGDAELFFKIYNSLKDIDGQGIMAFLTLFNDRRGEMHAPDVLMAKFSEYIIDSVKTVFVAECQQYGVELLNTIKNHPDVHFTLCTRNAVWASILGYVYAEFNNVEIIIADIYTDGFVNTRFDLIFAIPIIGMRTQYEDQDFICKDSDMIAVQNLLYHINLDGRLVIVLPAKITFGSGSIAALRTYIEENYSIKEISTLPAGLFMPYTSIRTFMFVFGNGSSEEVMLRRYDSDKPIRHSEPCHNLVLAEEEMLFPDEFANLSGWNIDMAFNSEDEDMRAFADSDVKKVLLKEVTTVFRGKAVSGNDPSGNVGVINISNISDAGIDYSTIDLIHEDERKASKYFLEDGDVLVTSRGTTIKVAVFNKQDRPCIPSVNLNVIRPSSMINGYYLKLFLETPVGTKLLKGLQRGTTVMNINYKDLNDLEIPLLTLGEQKAIIDDYNAGFEEYKRSIAEANNAWSKIKDSIQSRLF